jgi:hypothetical protein
MYDLKDALEKTTFRRPFKSDGTPKKFLALIIPLFNNSRVKKLTLLNSMDHTITERNIKDKRGSHSSTLAALVDAGILKTEPRGNGWWYRGDHWNEYVNLIVEEMMKHEMLRAKFTNMLVKYDSNMVDFFKNM